MMPDQLFDAALGIAAPWAVQQVQFDAAGRQLTLVIDFAPGSRFAHPDAPGRHPVHDTQTKRYRHLNFFQYECYLEVRVPRVTLPDGSVRLVEPPWAGQLAGFTLRFEALVLALCQQMPFAAVARIVGESWHRVHRLCERDVERATAEADRSGVTAVALDETAGRRGHAALTIAADAEARRVLFVTEGREAETVAHLATYLTAHRASPFDVESVSIDMSPAFIKGVTEWLPNATITFDKFPVVAQASTAVDEMRRQEHRTEPSLKGLRWALRKSRERLSPAQRADLDVLLTRLTTTRTARAWLYREPLREILSRKPPQVVAALLTQWCTNAMRSKVEPMKAVAAMIRRHFAGILAWTHSRQTNGFLEALNGLFQAAKRKARGYTRFCTMRTVLFLIASKLDFSRLNPHAV
jgi:transposase